ncbi:hypothetical protein ACTFIZ_006062 [Dictyostelium cf. discoideum]
MNNSNNIFKFITSNIQKQVILNKNNKILKNSLYLNNYYNRNIENAKIINQTTTTTTTTTTIIVPSLNNSKNFNNIIRNYSNRSYRRYNNDDNKDNNDNNNGRLNFLPSKENNDSLLERISGVLVGLASVALLVYVFYDGAFEIVINNLIFKKTVDTLRSNEKVQAVFGQDFTAKGLGFRSNGSFNYKHSVDKNGDKIVFISFMIESEKGKIGVVECKSVKTSTLDLEIKILKVKYENYKTITIVDEALPKKFNNKLKNFLSIFGITINNNNNNGGNSGSGGSN